MFLPASVVAWLYLLSPHSFAGLQAGPRRRERAIFVSPHHLQRRPTTYRDSACHPHTTIEPFAKMSKTVHIESTAQFSSLIASSKIVVADCMEEKPRMYHRALTKAVHATWCGPCKQIAPMYEQLSAQLSRPQKITFTKIDVDQQKELARSYGVTA